MGVGPVWIPAAKQLILTPYIAMSCIRVLANLMRGTRVRRVTSVRKLRWYLFKLPISEVLLPLITDPNVLF